ncbi:hypothetical protein HY642_03220 [Candidatus Woesearchaeota archaeon]|nr:hypothetical protein [Candidatus Woesearchaeota archaeon]
MQKHKSTTKVKRLSLYPKAQEPAPQKRPKRLVLTLEKPPLKAKKLPYFKDTRPQYSPAQQPAQQAQVPAQQVQPGQAPQAPVKPAGLGIGGILSIILIVFLVAFLLSQVIISNGGDNGGGGLSQCPTRCDGAAITIHPSCSCPSDSRYYSTIETRGYAGYKQCVCD